MSTKIYANARYGFRSDTLAAWQTENPILEKGEPSIVSNASDEKWLKIGDGETHWNDLPWYIGPKGDKGEDGAKGDKGDTGSSGVYIGTEKPTDEGVNVWIDLKGEYDYVTSVETDEKYFDIDYDGIISLKPEYRGHPAKETYPYAVSDNGVGVDGSKNNELPERIVIPDVIDGTAVSGLQEGMFYGNERIKELTIPDVVEEIPAYFCREAVNLKTVNGTENVTKVANSSFAYTRVAKLLFPNLQEMASGAFGACSYLYSIDIGNNVTEIPKRAFYQCQFLSCVKGGSKVTTIGEEAFFLTTNLKNLPLLSNVTSICNYAFYRSRIQFDWATIESQCEFGDEQPTPVRDNADDYWTGVDYTPCELPLNTIMTQQDDRWDGDLIGTTTRDNGDAATYLYGCTVFSILHIHSAFSGKEYTHPDEFIAEVQAIDPTLYTSGHPADSANGALAALGYTVTIVQPAYTDGDYVTKKDYEDICAALARGAYVLSSVSTTESENGGHEVVIYGINSNGEVLVVDSNCVQEKYRATGGDEEMKSFSKYRMPLQNLTGPYSGSRIVEKG